MISHHDIEQRSLTLAQEVVKRIDSDPQHQALATARDRCRLWLEKAPCPDLIEWRTLLDRPWAVVRLILLDESEEGRRLRQSNPFCGVLTPQERWSIYRRFRTHDKTPA